MNSTKKVAFTLIELLIVIVIIGILAGVVLAIINPARLITRANEGTARSRVAKACLAYVACLDSTRLSTTGAIQTGLCDTEIEMGTTGFVAAGNSGTYTLGATGAPQWASGTCTIACTTAGAVTVAAGCIIQQ